MRRAFGRTFWPAPVLAALVLVGVGSAQAAPGALDTSFGTGGKVATVFGVGGNDAYDVLVLPDRKIVAAGSTSDVLIPADFALARYKQDGSLDASFGTGGTVTTSFGSSDDFIRAIARQPDGKIVAAGSASQSGSPQFVFGLARYNSNGSLDTAFGTGGKLVTSVGPVSGAFGTVLQPDGKIVAAGITRTGLDADFALVRYNPDGSLDTTFGAGGAVTTAFRAFEYAAGVALQPDGKIVAAGTSFSSGFADSDFALARYNPDGSLDTSFGSGGKVTTAGSSYDNAYAVALQPNGKILVVGQTGSGGLSDFALARYNSNGSLDTSFGTAGRVATPIGSGHDTARDLALQLNGKIVAAGSSHDTLLAREFFALARYKPNGSLDTSFGADGRVTTAIGPSYDSANTLVLQPDGKIVLAGTTDTTGADVTYGFALARYQGDTCVVPRVKGKRRADAKRAIKRATCAVGKVKKKFSKKVKKGRVISQKPAARTKVASATKVNLVTSKGPRR